ncbi:outer membrane protein assembly factor BamC [Methylonatrum kenyense]|uniref:outer membrane protein assembly factor BamC n=1 Tax=Methylonatrum kenyense TaxID=455253 RepID=UPI0020BF04AE|nr:outer membrane protein assembly factor BamC [Methylonatrum kenyense]MCK8516198.1 outer membrane protein assembly factor BamC [Methylonatrum kenyense]
MSRFSVCRFVLVLLLVGGLSACSMFGRGGDQPVDEAERLTIPPDLSDERIGSVPDTQGRQSARLSDLAAGRGGGLLPEAPGMQIQRYGSDRWLELEAGPDQVWRWLNRYLDDNDVEVVRRSQSLGLVETDWLPRPLGVSGGIFMPIPMDADAPVREQYLFRLEPLTGGGGTELYVAHRRAVQVERDGEMRWEPRDAERGREAEALRGFMVHMGMAEAEAARAGSAADAGPIRTAMESDNGVPRLVIEEPYLQGWRRTGLALDRAGFTVEDRDRSAGRYVVRYDPAAEADRGGRGFFSRLAFWRDREEELEPGNYVIRVQSEAGRTVLGVAPEDDEGSVSAELAEQLLALIEEQLR